jgi:hypothetical protein
LVVTGTGLVWLPIVAPLIFAVVALATRGRFLFDYLMPAEIFPAAFVGGALLVWAAWRARLRRRLIGWAFVLMPVLLIASQGLAVATGLASGETQTGGWEWVAVLVLLAGFTLAMIVLGVAGVLLVRDLSRRDGTRAGE